MRRNAHTEATAAAAPATTLAALLAAWAIGLAPAGAGAKLYVTRDDALALAFGDTAAVTTRTAYLGEDEVRAVGELARAPFDARRVTYYEARRGDGSLLGHAYIETHRVRTMAETIMVVIDPDGRTARIDVLAFHEPEDYLAPERWVDLLEERELQPSLAPGRDLPNLAGATLTARALAAGVRRSLALHQVLQGRPGGGARPAAATAAEAETQRAAETEMQRAAETDARREQEQEPEPVRP